MQKLMAHAVKKFPSLLIMICCLLILLLQINLEYVHYLRLDAPHIFATTQFCNCKPFAKIMLTLSPPLPLRPYTLPHWSNPPFLIFNIWALWRSVLSGRAPECQKLKLAG